jgi:hypothetical protein
LLWAVSRLLWAVSRLLWPKYGQVAAFPQPGKKKPPVCTSGLSLGRKRPRKAGKGSEDRPLLQRNIYRWASAYASQKSGEKRQKTAEMGNFAQ